MTPAEMVRFSELYAQRVRAEMGLNAPWLWTPEDDEIEACDVWRGRVARLGLAVPEDPNPEVCARNCTRMWHDALTAFGLGVVAVLEG